jgi:hypothetical protein
MIIVQNEWHIFVIVLPVGDVIAPYFEFSTSESYTRKLQKIRY